MDSDGIWADLRRFIFRGDVFGLAVAVLVGTAIFQLLYALVDGVAVPFFRGVFDARSLDEMAFGATQEPLYFTFRGYTVFWGEVLSLVVVFTAGLMLVVFLRRQLFSGLPEPELEVEEEDEGDFGDQTEYKTCPECLSDIPAAARRCAYCTTLLDEIQK